MRTKVVLAVVALPMLVGCSTGATEITSADQASVALEKVGFNCEELSLRAPVWDNLSYGNCDSSVDSSAVFIGLAPTPSQFVNSMRFECMQAVYGPGKADQILVGDSWFISLSEKHASLQSLEEIRQDLGGQIDTVIGFCASIE